MPQRNLPSGMDQPMPAESHLDCTSEENREGCSFQDSSSIVMLGLRAECTGVWFEHTLYEQAESSYYIRLQGRENGTASSASSAFLTCHHDAQDACHHVVQSVWVNKPSFDQAERRFVEQSPQRPISMDIPMPLPLQNRGPTPETPCDEGYLSLTPTPPSTAVRSVNGLPRLPVHMLGVWLQKPLYDRVEALFYQNLCSQATPLDNLHSNIGEERVAEEVIDCISEEAEPDVIKPQEPEKDEDEDFSEDGREMALHYFLHPDSERVWLDRIRYVEAETRYYERASTKATRPTPTVHCSPSVKEYDMTGVDYLAQEKIWFDKSRYDEAERRFYERMNGPTSAPTFTTQDSGANSILQDIARARENIQKSLAGLKTSLQPSRSPVHVSQYPFNSSLSTAVPSSVDTGELITRMKNLEVENQNLHKVVEELRTALSKLEGRVAVLEKRPAAVVNAAPVNTAPQKTPVVTTDNGNEETDDDDDDDDLDLFGSDDEEDEDAKRLKEQRVKEYAERKAKKPALIAKSSILLDVKPWDDETDMSKLEECVRSVQADGLVWGSSKLVPVGYGIKKLQIQCVVEDDKVGTDMLEEEITKFEDYVQSVDVAAFNKI